MELVAVEFQVEELLQLDDLLWQVGEFVVAEAQLRESVLPLVDCGSDLSDLVVHGVERAQAGTPFDQGFVDGGQRVVSEDDGSDVFKDSTRQRTRQKSEILMFQIQFTVRQHLALKLFCLRVNLSLVGEIDSGFEAVGAPSAGGVDVVDYISRSSGSSTASLPS